MEPELDISHKQQPALVAWQAAGRLSGLDSFSSISFLFFSEMLVPFFSYKTSGLLCSASEQGRALVRPDLVTWQWLAEQSMEGIPDRKCTARLLLPRSCSIDRERLMSHWGSHGTEEHKGCLKSIIGAIY